MLTPTDLQAQGIAENSLAITITPDDPARVQRCKQSVGCSSARCGVLRACTRYLFTLSKELGGSPVTDVGAVCQDPKPSVEHGMLSNQAEVGLQIMVCDLLPSTTKGGPDQAA